MQALRFVVVLAVLGYAGWLAWPLVQPLLEGLPPGLIDGAIGPVPIVAVWAVAIVLYLIAALMLGSGNSRAVLAYFFGFLADVAVKLAIEQGRSAAPEISAKSTSADAMGPMAAPAPVEAAASGMGVEPLYLVIGALVVLGLLVFLVSQRRRRARTPGHLAA